MSIKKILSISLAIILIFSLDFYVNKKRPIKTIVFIVLTSQELLEQYGGISFLGAWKKTSDKKELSLENPILINYSGFNPEDFHNYFLNEINKNLSINPLKKLEYKTNPIQKYSKLLSTHFHLLFMFDRNLTSKEMLIIKNINQEYLIRNNFHYSLNLKTITFND